MTDSSYQISPDHALRQAAEWAVELGDNPSSGTLYQWQSWLNQHQQHQQAWLKIQQVQARFQTVENSQTAKGVLANTPERQIKRREFIRRLAAFGSLSMGAGWVTNQTQVGNWVANLSADAHTNIGQRRQIKTFAGDLWLNTVSAINLNDRPNQLIYELLDGELALNSMGNQAVIQRMRIDDANIISKQARYAARRFSSGHYQISVFEGQAIALVNQQRIHIPARQSLIIKDHTKATMTPVAPHAISWTKGRLEALDLPLATLVGELNRYTIGHIHVDETLKSLRVMGSFPLDDLDSSTQLLAQIGPIKVTQPLPYLTLIQSA
ncbi:DUF4880 domain-containing protein [Rhodanobacter aciditrophus]|uniref:DUF4880 domain-containing protein n=1 Tax=Rhodanobacter aciditrophus TaxID=1623218 RepID=A0ABW4B3K5_9GAMM